MSCLAMGTGCVTRTASGSSDMLETDLPDVDAADSARRDMTPFDRISIGPELAIVLDCTSSMSVAMEALPRFLVEYAVHRFASSISIEAISLVAFDDHYRDEITRASGRSWRTPLRSFGPTDNLEEFAFWLRTLEVGFGADSAEAIACALARSRAVHPTATTRWLITDTVPHGVPGYVEDTFPKGCPCETALDTSGVSVVLIDDLDVASYWGSMVGEGNVVLTTDDLRPVYESRNLK